MGERKRSMNYEFKKCLDNRKLVSTSFVKRLVNKELKVAEEDLKSAKRSFKERSLKWATVQGYYSMLHAARALIFSRGYREKTHYCLGVALKALFVEKGIINHGLYRSFTDAMELRENADYKDNFSREGAKEVIEGAEKLLGKAKEILSARIKS